MSVQQTSIDSFNKIVETDLGDRQLEVFNGFKNHGVHTNLEMSKILGIPINQLTPRTNELVKFNFLEEKDRRKCDVSGRLCIVWGIK